MDKFWTSTFIPTRTVEIGRQAVLTIILAHFGRGYYEETVALGQKYPNLFFDTAACFYESASSNANRAEQICRMIQKVGATRVLLGAIGHGSIRFRIFN